ncbi:hypothetical protein Asi03nite_49770 [Actinoplanes siamensis]|uniref:Uncharacterized protein n=2 Tax=Actinoplanes siamensis TaxID=1223317 RepID=A0A919NAY4_9ACTN|nr:hypothetical protein [Actinoplanes siamensis]GIF07439.1 hypothetical protein Asi03nite_49770 [Actinoplanes siamensis]
MPTLEDRVANLEERMDEQERLRASQDRDQSELGLKLAAQDRLLKSLAKTQSEHTAILNRHTTILNRHTGMFEEHAAILAQHTADLHLLKGGVQQIIGMLDTLIAPDGDR